MVLEGKGFFTWKIPACERGDINAIISIALASKLTHVLIKIADGTVAYDIDDNTGVDYAFRLTKALRSNGIKAWGWHYVYGDSPLGEANIAIQRVRQLDLDGYVIDAEDQYQEAGKKEAAKKFINQLRTALPDLPVALSTYRYPSYHQSFPWKEFLRSVTW